MGGEWRLYQVKEIAEHSAAGPFGSTIGAKNFQASGVPVIRGSNLSAEISSRLVDEGLVFINEDLARKFSRSEVNRGDLVFTCWGTIDQVGLIDKRSRYERYIVSNKQMLLRPDPAKADSLYLYYHFSSPLIRTTIINSGIGSSVPGFNLGQLRSMSLALPPLPEQQAIAAILGSLDDKIELNRQRNRTLEAMARALFQSWFVDFDPVKAKAAGKKPPGLNPEIAAHFPDSFETSTPLLPKGWTMYSLNSLCEIGRGSSPRPIHNFMGGDVPWIKIADATAAEGPFIYSTKEYVTKEGSEKSFWVSPGDLILSNSATCGVPIYVGIRGCIHDGWLHFSNLKIISKGFLYHWLHSISEHLIHIADGSVQKNLNTKLVGEQRIVIAPSSILNHFEQLNSVVFCQIDCHIRELKTLKALRDTLLPRLISGELRVRDAERIIARNV